MNQSQSNAYAMALNLPHARGDEPIIATVVATAIIFAPRTWGEIFKRGWIK